MERDHLFNRSTRPLLESRSTNQNHHAIQVKAKKSPIVDYKLHGFNDFNFVANQYKNLSHSHSGYPYGSPPSSPKSIANRMLRNQDNSFVDSLGEHSSDFIFSDDSGIHINNSSAFSNQSTPPNVSSTLSTSNYFDDVMQKNENEMQKNYGKKGLWNVWRRGDNDTTTKIAKSSKKLASIAPTTAIDQFNGNNGPFIFGVHSNGCYSLPKVNNETVINSTAAIASAKYSVKSDEVSKFA